VDLSKGWYPMTNPASEIYERLNGRGPLTFDELPPEAQKAADVYYGEDIADRGWRFGLVEMTVEQARTLVWEFRSDDMRSDWSSFDEWHQWYVECGLDADTYSENWPLVLSSDQECDGLIEDGWHRFNSYIVQGRTSMMALVLLDSGETDMTEDITFDIGGWPLCSGTKVKIYLEGETGRVYSYGDVGGNSMPGEAFHGLDICLLVVDKDVVVESLQAWLEERMDTLCEVHDCFEGSPWNGSNHVGQWDDDRLQELLDGLEQDMADEPLPTYWEAGDFLGDMDASTLEAEVLGKGLDNVVEEYVTGGEGNGYHVRDEDLREEIERRLRDVIYEAREDGETERAERLTAALA